MKKMTIIASLLLSVFLVQPAFASLFDSYSVDTPVSAVVDVNSQYIEAMLQLSTDIGTMADRIVTSEELILQMADRIVETERLMAQLTVIMAQIAAGQTVDADVATQLSAAIDDSNY